MKRMKQLTALVLAAVMVLSLAACGGSTAGKQPGSQTVLQQPAQKPTPNRPAAPVPQETEPVRPTVPAEPVVTPLELPTQTDRDALEEIAGLVSGGELNMTWADVTNLIMYYNEGGSYSVSDGYITTADHCTFRMNYGDGHIRYRNLSDGTVHDQLSNSGMMTHFRLATNCVFYKMALTYGLDVRGTLEGCIFADSALNFYQYGYTVRNCVFLGNCVGIETWDRTAIATTLQIPVPERQYNADLMRGCFYPVWNMSFFVSTQNSPMTRQLMAELGYSPVTIDSEEMAQWLYEYTWDVLGGYASRAVFSCTSIFPLPPTARRVLTR